MCLGGSCVSQVANGKLRAELCAILSSKTAALACIPVMSANSPLYEKCWIKYEQPKYVGLYGKKQFGSAFVSRPDSAPWINTLEYWAEIEKLWDKKDVVLVVGESGGSLTPEMMEGAKSIRVVTGPRRDAYAVIDSLEAMIDNHTAGPILICLGACATALAERLAKKGLWAVDIGHLGRFLPDRGKLWHQRTRAEKGKEPL